MPPGSDQITRARALLQDGKGEAALQLLAGFVTSQPNNAEAHHLLARALNRKNKAAQALTHAEHAFALAPQVTDHCVLLGQLYLRFKLFERAMPLLEKALHASPQSFALNRLLAECYFSVDLGHRAAGYFEAALAHGPDGPTLDAVKIKYAECLFAINEPARADALLADMAQTSSLRDAARLLRGMNCSKPIDPHIEADLNAMLGRTDLTADARAQALLGLGRICDARGEHDQAFAHWQQSRALLGVKAHSKQALALRNLQTRAIYSAAVMKDAAPMGDPSEAPIFVVGMPRSGTTLTAQILAAHSAVVSVGETDRINTLDIAFRKDYWHENPGEKILANARNGELKARAQETLAFFGTITDPGWSRVVEKSPTNYESLGYIHLCFPKARIIHCRRHPADNFISAYQLNMNRQSDYAYDQVAFAERYVAQVELMNYWKSCFGVGIFDLDYEALVAEPEALIRRLIAFAGLPWEDACLKFNERKATVRTFSAQQVRNPIYTTSAGRWKRYEKHLGPLLKSLDSMGYRHQAG
jgi:tetratricopeptide (TPR) repeat protein